MTRTKNDLSIRLIKKNGSFKTLQEITQEAIAAAVNHMGTVTGGAQALGIDRNTIRKLATPEIRATWPRSGRPRKKAAP